MSGKTLSNMVTVHMKDLSQGLFSDVNPFEVPLGGASACSNLVWVDGYMRPRPGLSEDYPTFSTDSILHINRWVDENLEGYIARFDKVGSDIRFSVLKQSVGVWNNIGTIIGAANSDYPPTSEGWKYDLWFTTGDGGVYRYDPVGNTLDSVLSLATYPNRAINDSPRLMVAGDSRLFIANVLTSNDGSNSGDRVPSRLCWSDYLNGQTWKAGTKAGSAGYVEFPNAEITGLYYSGSVLMVFQPTRIWTGFAAGPPFTYDFRQRTSGVGCIASQTIRRYRDGWVYWLGDDNVYRGGTDRSPEPVGDRIRRRIYRVADRDNLSRSRAIIDRENHLYHLIIPSNSGSLSGRVVHIFTLNLKNNSWWEGVFQVPDINITDTLELRTGPWNNKLVLTGDNGKIYNMSFSNLSDDGNTFPVSWISGDVSVPDISQGKAEQARIQHFRVKGTEGRMSFQVNYGDNSDRMTRTKNFGTQNLDGNSYVYISERPYDAEIHRLVLSNPDASTAPQIQQMAVGVMLGGGSTRK